MKYCGIDLASKTSAICIEDTRGNIIKEVEVATEEATFWETLKGYGEITCIIEACPLAEWAAQLLEAAGHQAIIIDPRRAKALIRTKKKTDKIDAQKLAKMGRTGWYTQVHRKSAQARLLRSTLKARKSLMDTTIAQQNRIRGILRAHGIRVGEVSEGQFENRVESLIQQTQPSLMPLITPLLAVRKLALEEAKQLKKHLKQQGKKDSVCQYLMTTPGVGPLVSAAFVATIDDPHRFKKSSQVSAYVGLVPSVNQSGDTEYRGRITKEGDSLLRWLLIEAANVLLTRTKKDFALKRWGLKIAQKKGGSKARVAVARKLAALLHKLWINEETFDWAKA